MSEFLELMDAAVCSSQVPLCTHLEPCLPSITPPPMQDGAAPEHWGLKLGLQFYMAQCPIMSEEVQHAPSLHLDKPSGIGKEGVPAVLPFLASKLPPMRLLDSQEMAQVPI